MSCHFCGSENTKSIFFIGQCPIAGNFISKIEDDNLVDLNVIFCKDCGMAQIDSRLFIPKEKLFRRYFYKTHSIKTLVDFFIDEADRITDMFGGISLKVLEIGGNSCPLGEKMVQMGLGHLFVNVDPSNVSADFNPPGVKLINEFFDMKVVDTILDQYGTFDVIYTANNFAHMENIHEVVQGIQRLLRRDGHLIIQVQDFDYLLDSLYFPLLYHEHLYYYNQYSLPNFLSNFGFELVGLSKNPIHGRSIRAVFKRSKNSISFDKSYIKDIEDRIEVFKTRLNKVERDVIEFLEEVNKTSKKIVAYGASGQANILFAKFGIFKEQIPYIIDDAPLKQGKMTPYSHIPIKDSSFLREYNPDYIFVTAYTFFDEIKKRNEWFDGTWVIPLPELQEIN